MRPLPIRDEVIYQPPKASSFGHATIPRDPKKGWLKTLAFLETLTESSLPREADLTIRSHAKWTDVEVTRRCLEEATAQFGPATRVDGELTSSWSIPVNRVHEAVNFALLDLSRPPQELGPTWLGFSYDFWWKPHAALPALQRPGEGSNIGIIHGGRRLFLQPTFRFPFEAASPLLTDFIAHVQPHLPFRLRESYFKQLLASAAGKAPRVRKLPAGWLVA